MSSHTGTPSIMSAFIQILGHLQGHGPENARPGGFPGTDGHTAAAQLSSLAKEKDRVLLSHRQSRENAASNPAWAPEQAPGKKKGGSTITGAHGKAGLAPAPFAGPGERPGRKEPSAEEDAEKALEIWMEMQAERQVHLARLLAILYEAETEITELIAEASARRAKVTGKIAEKWASVLSGGAD